MPWNDNEIVTTIEYTIIFNELHLHFQWRPPFHFVDLVLKDKIIVYDLARQRIGWANYDCKFDQVVMHEVFPSKSFLNQDNCCFTGSSSVNVSVTSGKDVFINEGQLSVSSSSRKHFYQLLNIVIVLLIHLKLFWSPFLIITLRVIVFIICTSCVPLANLYFECLVGLLIANLQRANVPVLPASYIWLEMQAPLSLSSLFSRDPLKGLLLGESCTFWNFSSISGKGCVSIGNGLSIASFKFEVELEIERVDIAVCMIYSSHRVW